MSASRASVGQNSPVDDDRTGADDPVPAPVQVPWVLDAALGAASMATRFAGGIASAVVRSTPAHLVEDVARRLSRPLTAEGEAARGRLGGEGVPAAQELIRGITPALVDAVDLDAILGAVDVEGLLDRIDVGGVVDRVDVDGVVGKVDIDGIVARVDLDELMQRVDVGALLARIDINGLLDRIDLDAVLAKVDLNELLASVDLDALLADLDLNAVIERLDVDGLIANTEMGAIIVRSTGGAASEVLDTVRSQGVSIDSVVARIANRILRRDLAGLPPGPELLVQQPLALPTGDTPLEADSAEVDPPETTTAEDDTSLTGPEVPVARRGRGSEAGGQPGAHPEQTEP